MPLTGWAQELGMDARFSLRQLRRAPGFAIIATLTLALGIGANSAIFALADATLIRPLPYPEADRLMVLWEGTSMVPRGVVAPPTFRDWHDRNRTFESMASVFINARNMTGLDGHADLVPAQSVTAAFFDMLGITPVAGRTFQAADVTPEPRVVVLSETFWRMRYGGDPSIVGRAIRLDDNSYTVIGVVPARFQLFGATDIWLLAPALPGPNDRGLRVLQVIGRLRKGVTREAAAADMRRVADAIALESPASNKGRGVTLEPLRDVLIGPEVRTTSVVLFGVVGFVLLMCCANVANLLLARMTGRTREIAVRSALGAGRRRIVAQILTESLVLSSLGGLLGLGVAALILRSAPSLIPAGLLPAALTLAFDGRIAAFCAASAFMVGLVFGLVPAWQATSTSFAQVMNAEGRGTTRGGGRLRSLVVAAEIAAAVLLLCGAGLLLRTLLALHHVEGGFGTDNVLTMRLSPPHITPGARYPTQEALRRFYDAVEREVEAAPGVRSAGWVTSLPLEGSSMPQAFEIVGDSSPDRESTRPLSNYDIVSPSYFDTVGIPLRQGRQFTASDVTGGAPVAIIDEAFARRYFRGRNPIGERLSINPLQVTPARAVVREIVGVAGQVRERADQSDESIHVYVPQSQNAWLTAALVVRPVSGPAARLATSVRAAIARVDAKLPVTATRTLEEVTWDSTARYRFRAVLVASFAGLALLLAMVGVFGVLAYTVQQRLREFGVRIALGAGMRDVMHIVVTSAARTTIAGAAIGLVGAAVLSRSLATLLYDVRPLDPVTFVVALLVLVATAALATVVPAYRAARVDPLVTFRND